MMCYIREIFTIRQTIKICVTKLMKFLRTATVLLITAPDVKVFRSDVAVFAVFKSNTAFPRNRGSNKKGL